MSDYIGKVCPYCKTQFVPGDDIVVCSDCDMPHHKDCWVENQGCTTFGCLGTIKTAENVTTSVTSSHMNYDDSGTGTAGGVMFCSQCGARNFTGASFCSQCGSRLAVASQAAPQVPACAAPDIGQQAVPYQPQVDYQQPAYQQPNYQQPNYQHGNFGTYQQPYGAVTMDPHLRHLVGPKWAYYLPKFRQLKAQGKSASWNWAAFLAPSYWMLYRKMYLYGAIAAVIEILCAAINSVLLSLLLIGGCITVGILGNFIYMKHLEDKAEEARTVPETYKTDFLLTNGGVNTAAVVLTAVGRVVFTVFLLALQM